VPASTIQRIVPPDGSRVIPVGLDPAPVMVQLPTSEPDVVYLKTLSVVESSTTQRFAPSVTTPFGLLLPLFRAKLLAAFWLPESRLAAPEYMNTLSLLASTIQTSVPLVAIPSTVAFDARRPAGGVEPVDGDEEVVDDVAVDVDVADHVRAVAPEPVIVGGAFDRETVAPVERVHVDARGEARPAEDDVGLAGLDQAADARRPRGDQEVADPIAVHVAASRDAADGRGIRAERAGDGEAVGAVQRRELEG
jgi:hypothetical protein